MPQEVGQEKDCRNPVPKPLHCQSAMEKMSFVKYKQLQE